MAASRAADASGDGVGDAMDDDGVVVEGAGVEGMVGAGVTAAGGGVTTAGVVSSFLPHAVRAAAATSEAINRVFFMAIPLGKQVWTNNSRVAPRRCSPPAPRFAALAYKPNVDEGNPGFP